MKFMKNFRRITKQRQKINKVIKQMADYNQYTYTDIDMKQFKVGGSKNRIKRAMYSKKVGKSRKVRSREERTEEIGR